MNATSPTTTPRAADLTATFESEKHGWTRRRSTRRAGVVGEVVLLGAALAGTLVAAALDTRTAGLAFAVASLVVLVAFVPLHAVVNLGVRGLFDRRDTSLDEVQRRQRDRSSTAVTVLRLVLSLAAVVVAVRVAEGGGDTTFALAAGFLLWFASWLTSVWHLAWTLPEEPSGD